MSTNETAGGLEPPAAPAAEAPTADAPAAPVVTEAAPADGAGTRLKQQQLAAPDPAAAPEPTLFD